MKGGLAAMVTASEEFVAAHAAHKGSIAFLITSDEEGPSVDGTRRVAQVLRERGERLDWCVVGEPSSEVSIGDTIKVGRRGDRKSTRLNSSHSQISYAVFCLKKKKLK